MSLTKVTYSMIDGQYLNAQDFGATGDGVTNDTAALNAAYAAAAASKQDLYIPSGDYLFTSQLVWDENVSVYGQREFTNLRKQGNFDGVLITDAAQNCTFSSFNVKGNPGNGGSGIVIRGTSYIFLENIGSLSHALDGIYIDNTLATGTVGTFKANFTNIVASANGRDGIAIDGTGPGTLGDPTNVCNSCVFNNINLTGNGEYGFKQYGNSQAGYHVGLNIGCENNGVGGMLIEGIANFMSIYVESNGAAGLNLGSTSTRNVIVLQGEDVIIFKDNGTNNTLIGGGFSGIKTSEISSPRNPANVVGRDFIVSASSSVSTSAALKGGDVYVFSGNAAGPVGSASGGRLYLQSGTGVGGGSYGYVAIQPVGGGVVIGSENSGSTSVLVKFDSTTRAVQYVGITTAQRDLLTALAGMVIFNSSTSKLQVFDGSTWVDLH
jgi:hypothetical protein